MGAEMIVVLTYGQTVMLFALIIMVAAQSVMIHNLTKSLDELAKNVVYRENCITRIESIREIIDDLRNRIAEEYRGK